MLQWFFIQILVILQVSNHQKSFAFRFKDLELSFISNILPLFLSPIFLYQQLPFVMIDDRKSFWTAKVPYTGHTKPDLGNIQIMVFWPLKHNQPFGRKRPVKFEASMSSHPKSSQRTKIFLKHEIFIEIFFFFTLGRFWKSANLTNSIILEDNFSNSLITHSIKTKKITSVYSLVFGSIQEKYQTLETVCHRLSKHLDNFVKNTPLRVVFSTLFSVFRYPDETLSLVFEIFLTIQPFCLK